MVNSMKLHIQKQGFRRETCPLHGEEVIDIVVDKRVNASLFLTYVGVDANIIASIVLKEGSSLTLMMKNEMQGICTLKQECTLQKDSHLRLAYVEMEACDSEITTQVNLAQRGAQVTIRSACIAQGRKHMQITCTHQVPDTYAQMENYAVVKTHGDYCMEACGKIMKGAYGSVSHQTTRVLTMSEQQQSLVIPLLLIDEDQVKASHATSVGQPDENQLYYLQTRGLSRDMALGLLTVGYLMPVSELFDDSDIQQELKNEIEMKVGLHA